MGHKENRSTDHLHEQITKKNQQSELPKKPQGRSVYDLIRDGVAGEALPFIRPEPIGLRKDTMWSFSEAFLRMDIEEDYFLRSSDIVLPNGDYIVFLSLPAISPHTPVKLQTQGHIKQLSYITSPEALSLQDKELFPAQQYHWIFFKELQGDAKPIDYTELARYPDDLRDAILSEFSNRLVIGKQTMDAALRVQGIHGAENGAYIYATAGHHAKALTNNKDGYSRGTQSNSTIHSAVTFFPPKEDLLEKRDRFKIDPATLLKQIDPLSAKFFDFTKESLASVLERNIAKKKYPAQVTIISEDESHQEPFSFGWKVTFTEPSELKTGWELVLQFINQMEEVWEEAKKYKKNQKAKTNYRKIFKKPRENVPEIIVDFIGAEGAKALEKVIGVKSVRTLEDYERLKRGIKAVEKRLDRSELTEENRKALEVYVTLLRDLLEDGSKFSVPGVPSFNLLFDVNTESGKLQSLYITPALSEKGVAERITGGVLERPERS